MLQPFPKTTDITANEKAFEQINWLKAVISAVRNIRGEVNIAPKTEITLQCRTTNASDQHHMQLFSHYLGFLAKVNNIQWLDADAPNPKAATAVVDGLELFVPLAGLIDVSAETERLEKQLVKIEKDLGKVQNKLNNPKYIDNAPSAMIETDREAVASLTEKQEKLTIQLDIIKNL